ncbi:MAG: HD family phosphohydrolase [Xenococcaceae cyanobacterium]
MKTFDSLTRQLGEWRRKYQHLRPFFLPRKAHKSPPAKASTTPDKKDSPSRSRKAHQPLMFALTAVSLTSVVGYRFYNQPQLAVGTVSPVTIKAPRDGSFEDTKTTEEKRKEARNGIVPVLMQDTEITQQIVVKLATYLQQIGQLRQLAGPFPFVDVKVLSLPSQQYLRSCQEGEWQKILAALNNDQEVNPSEPGFGSSDGTHQQPNLAREKAIAELKTYRKQVSDSEFESLTARISEARTGYAKARKRFLEQRIPELGSEEKITLLRLKNETWQETRKSMLQALRRILTQGIPPGLPSNLIEETVGIQLISVVPDQTKPIATELLLEVLQPNLTVDKEETKRRAEQAVQAVKPVIVERKQEEVIVDKGQTITQEDFVLLDSFELSRRGINWFGLGLSGFLVTGAMGIVLLVGMRMHLSIRRRDHILLCLLSLSAPLLVIFRVPYTNLPGIGLLVSSFYSPTLAAVQVALLTGLVAFGSGGAGWEYLLAGAAGGLLAAVMGGRLRSREELAFLGGAVGLTQGGVYLIVNLILSAAAGTIWYAVLPGAIICGLSGVAWSVVALGLSPYLERLFDLVTPIRLAELSNPNRPLLKRLATEAPGTFQHTTFVACLAEAAARELHCNVELVRAGTLYHDIGKMHDPLGFIENQMGVPNKHDEINDPIKSAQIIKKHISEGLVMARKYGLPKAIQDFIPEHQGTLLISYFYFQAKHKSEKEGGKPPLESDFRYDGPIPQSRETGIVMLADSCEAALRSLKDATPETALLTINKIFKARWRDNQLVDSGLKREELSIIAEVFVKVWQQFNHRRIPYPKGALEPQVSGK